MRMAARSMSAPPDVPENVAVNTVPTPLAEGVETVPAVANFVTRVAVKSLVSTLPNAPESFLNVIRYRLVPISEAEVVKHG